MKNSIFSIFKQLSICIIIFNLACFAQKTVKPEPFEQAGLFGYKNEKGDVVIQPEYIMAEEFNDDGIAPVVDHQGWIYINLKGEKLFRPFIIDNGPDYFSEGLARFVENNKFGFFDMKGNRIIEPLFDFAKPFSEGLSEVCKGCSLQFKGEYSSFEGGKWGYIDKQGNIVIDYQFDSTNPFENGKALIEKSGKKYFIDQNGNKFDMNLKNVDAK
jgi:hypothetical protein